MPIYEYDCPVCGTVEAIQKFSDAPLKSCPICARAGKDSAVTRKISLSAFHLKGGGWYKTDYSNGGSNGKSSNGTNGQSKPEAKEAKTETATSEGAKETKSEKPASPTTTSGSSSAS